MYRYDAFDHAFVRQRVAQFRDQVVRRLSGELSEDEFRPLRLMNGLYLQLHAYMLRVAVPYGTLSARQLRGLAGIARRFDRGYGHFTTRQNIQFNWIKLENAADALEALADVEMHAIQTSGNCIRNVTSDAYAGVASDELEDPRILGELIRQWSSLHPEFSFLPRKFKIAITGATQDRAAIAIHDVGLKAVRNDAGEIGYQLLAGGGLGRTPILARVIADFVPRRDILGYLDAVLRVYNRHGRRDNIYKARIKILVTELGVERFRAEVAEEWRQMQASGQAETLAVDDALWQGIAAHFVPPTYTARQDGTHLAAMADHPDFAAWVKTNVQPHKVPGYAVAVITLKAPGRPPGDASADQMELIADLAERHGFGELRVTHAQNLVLPDVPQADLFALWQALDGAELATANLDRITDTIACPGLDYCALANARAIPLAQEISRHFSGREEELGALNIKMSGCINACGHHHVGHIGILGVDKHGEEAYQITLGGAAGDDAAIGSILGAAIAPDAVVPTLDRLTRIYLERRQEGERFIDTYRRIGLAPFKDHAAKELSHVAD